VVAYVGDELTWACTIRAKWTEATGRTHKKAAFLSYRSKSPHGHYRLLGPRAREWDGRLEGGRPEVEVTYLARQH